jgi:hypothetical protein
MKCLLVVLSDTSLFITQSGVLKFDCLCEISNVVTVSSGISFHKVAFSIL